MTVDKNKGLPHTLEQHQALFAEAEIGKALRALREREIYPQTIESVWSIASGRDSQPDRGPWLTSADDFQFTDAVLSRALANMRDHGCPPDMIAERWRTLYALEFFEFAPITGADLSPERTLQ